MKAILGFLHAMFGFLRTMMTFPKPWVVWIMLLMLVNMVIPLFYLGTLEGEVVLGAFVFGALHQGWIFSAKGFVRLLGIGHLVWIPMVAWLWTRLDVASTGSLFRHWLLATIVLVSLSLLIDAVDVIRYLRGERDPYVETPA